MIMDHNRPRFPDQDIVLVVRNPHRAGALGKLLSAIGEAGALVGDLTTRSVSPYHSIREITVSVYDDDHLLQVLAAIRANTEAEVIETCDLVFARHQGGKIHCGRKQDIKLLSDLRYIYTPGVARICRAIQRDPTKALELTGIGNSVGIFTNGTRVLGLGDIGPLPAMPVMEGKAVIYDQFVGISAVPILIDTKDPEEFIDTVVRVAPTFGGIHLEDIRMPDCFRIEDELIRRLNKPVMHDDQHGTATVLLAAVLTALRHTNRDGRRDFICAQIGLGAAGFGIAKLLIQAGFRVIGVDRNESACARMQTFGGDIATLEDAMASAEIIIATTGVVGLIKPNMIRKGQIILSLSNPIPEIFPEEALDAGAAYAADGKSVNNALAYPGLFRAALDGRRKAITPAMKIAAARAISSLAGSDELVPSPLNPHVHTAVIAAATDAFRREDSKGK
jgi:malate dehydrogenase (oxaloacetate-decarboxylating)